MRKGWSALESDPGHWVSCEGRVGTLWRAAGTGLGGRVGAALES